MNPHFKLVSPAVTLRAFTLEDADKVFRMSQEAAMKKWLVSEVYRDVAQAQAVLARLISHYHADARPARGPVVLGVEHPESGQLIGHVGLSPFREYVEVGFAIEEAQQRRGYATAAVTALCQWAAKAYSLATIHGFVAKENEASQRVLGRAGFVRIGEKTMPFQGSVEAVVIFAWTGN